jgi:hypothetical protein
MALQLLAEAVDVAVGGVARMGAGLDGVLLGRQAEASQPMGCRTLKPFMRL